MHINRQSGKPSPKCMLTHICLQNILYVNIYECIYIYIHIYIHTYIYIYI